MLHEGFLSNKETKCYTENNTHKTAAKKRLLIVLFAVFFLVFEVLSAGAGVAIAEDMPNTIPQKSPINSGGDIAASNNPSSYKNANIDNSLIWAGNSLEVTSSTIGGDIIVAGSSLYFGEVKAKQSLFAAAQLLKLADANLEGNIYACGEKVIITGASSARSVYAAAKAIEFSANAKYLACTGQAVAIGGTVDGDVEIYAEKIAISNEAVITGTLRVFAPEQPVIPDSAKIDGYEYVQVQSMQDAMSSIISELTAASGIMSMFFAFQSIFASIIIALLIFWLNRKTLTGAADMLRKRPAAIICSGLIVFFTAPIVLILLLFSLIGLQVAGVLFSLFVIVGLLMIPFAGASIGQMLFKKMPSLLAACLGALLAAVIAVVPILGIIIFLFANFYSLGYIVQWIWLYGIKHKSNNTPKNNNSRTVNSGEVLFEDKCEPFVNESSNQKDSSSAKPYYTNQTPTNYAPNSEFDYSTASVKLDNQQKGEESVLGESSKETKNACSNNQAKSSLGTSEQHNETKQIDNNFKQEGNEHNNNASSTPSISQNNNISASDNSDESNIAPLWKKMSEENSSGEDK